MGKYITPNVRIEVNGDLVDENATVLIARAIVARDNAERAFLRSLDRIMYGPF